MTVTDTDPIPGLSEIQSACEAHVLQLWAAQGGLDGAHDLGHLRRVWANCQRIARVEGGADMAVLLAAAMLHDAVNLPKDAPNRAQASRLSAQAAAQFLPGLGFGPGRIAAVAHAIEAHSFSAAIAPQTPEARILQDADRLEALGAIGIARMFHVAGALGAALFDAADPLALHRPLDDRAFALDHIAVKLVPVAESMQTAEGRERAAEALEWMESFRSRLLREIG